MVSRRTLEIGTAVLTGAFGTAILVSSLQIGVGWTSRGLGAGIFPAISGSLIILGSLYNLVRGAMHHGGVALDWPRAKKIGAILLPALVFVAAIPLLGLHVAAGAYVFGSLMARRERSLRRALAFGIATPLALYAIFDWGFQVALPRGLLGAALGF